MANCVGPDQTAPIGAVCSGSRLFASILNFSVMLGNYLQQTASANNIFRCIFFLGALRVKAGTGSQPLQAYRLGQWTACHKIHYLTLNAIFFNIREIHNAFFIMLISPSFSFYSHTVLLTLNAPITTKVICFSPLLKCLRSLYGKQCGPKLDCSYRSSRFWAHAVCF